MIIVQVCAAGRYFYRVLFLPRCRRKSYTFYTPQHNMRYVYDPFAFFPFSSSPPGRTLQAGRRTIDFSKCHRSSHFCITTAAAEGTTFREFLRKVATSASVGGNCGQTLHIFFHFFPSILSFSLSVFQINTASHARAF